MTWGELARAAGGRLARGSAADPVAALSTDSRTLRPGQGFWALKGPRFDAHDLLSPQLASVSGGWVVRVGRLPEGAPRPAHVVEVPDTLKALQALAAHHRRRFDIPVVGITGSNGKTTTKEMLKGICALVGPTCASPGNWNNQIGVPLSVLELTPEHRYGVFELADSHPGDIAEVGRVAQPTLGVLTNIGPDHLEFYGTLEANLRTKAELIDCLPPEGRVVLNIDDPLLAGLEHRLGPRAVAYGLGPKARVRFAGPGELILDGRRVRVALRAFGELSRYNAAAAAAAAWALGISADAIREGLESYRPGAMRLEPLSHPSGCAVVFDAYNANPASMQAAVAAFCGEFADREKVLVLGDMKELGPGSEAYHRELGGRLASLPLKTVYLVGTEMKPAFDALRAERPSFAFYHADTSSEISERLRGECVPGAAVFFKASRAMRLEELARTIGCSIT